LSKVLDLPSQAPDDLPEKDSVPPEEEVASPVQVGWVYPVDSTALVVHGHQQEVGLILPDREQT